MMKFDDCDTGTAYEIDIIELVPYVDPTDYGISDFVVAKPLDYFITSGDAVVKAEHLDKDIWAIAGKARQRFGRSKDKKIKEFQNKLWEMAGKCRTLLNMLKKIRGDAIFLELEWRDHKLYCMPKNPRKRDIDL